MIRCHMASMFGQLLILSRAGDEESELSLSLIPAQVKVDSAPSLASLQPAPGERERGLHN